MRTRLLLVCSLLCISTTAGAFDISGSYHFQENGCTGEMEIKEAVGGLNPHLDISIETVCSDDAHICQFEATGVRVISSDTEVTAMGESSSEDGEPAKFEIVFTPASAQITVQQKGGFCGAKAYYEGTWGKGKASTESSSTEPKVQTREDRIVIEKLCRFSAQNAYNLYLNAQNGVPSETSVKKLVLKIQKLKLDIDSRKLAEGIVEEIYQAYYKYGRMTKNDTPKKVEDIYFRNCMSNLIKN